MTDVEQRLRRLEDRAELQDLVVRYFVATDDDDVEQLADAFTSNGSFSISGALCGETREKVVSFLVGERTKMGLTVHVPDYSLFTFTDADRATGVVGAHLELALGGQTLFGAVRYHDIYVRDGGKWRIRTRNMRTIHIAPWADVGNAFKSDTPVHWPGMPTLASDFPRKR